MSDSDTKVQSERNRNDSGRPEMASLQLYPDLDEGEEVIEIHTGEDIKIEPSEFLEENPPIKLRLSIEHEEELVAKALELNSACKGIKWYYQKYRPEDFKYHNTKRDWTKNCQITGSVVFNWMQTFKETGYHKRTRRKKGQKQGPERPKTGPGSIQVITLSEYQKYLLVTEALKSKVSKRKTIKAFVKVHFPNEFINFEIYKDWDQCSITTSKLKGWVNNVNDLGCLNRPRRPVFLGRARKLAEKLHLAKSIIEDIKNSSEGTLDLSNSVSRRQLVAKMGISKKTAIRYLNILERGDADTKVASKRTRNGSSSSEMDSLELYPDLSSDEDTIEIDTGEEQRKDFFIGEADALADNEKYENIEFTAWTEIFPDSDFNHDNSYQARVLGKKANEPDDSSCDELIEVCPEDVKMEPMEPTGPGGYEYVVLSTDDAVSNTESFNISELSTNNLQSSVHVENDANPHIQQFKETLKSTSAGSAALSEVGALFLQFIEPLGESLIEHTSANLFERNFQKSGNRNMNSHEIIQYFLSELCMAAFLDPENGDMAEAANGKMEKQLESWLQFSINPSPLLNYER